MQRTQLAIHGGPKAVRREFKRYNPIGAAEANAAREVIDSGVLSRYLGSWGEDFFGGPKVKEFESACAKKFRVKHAITVNSWTSGLIAAVGAIGVEPGDEVIVSPWTMCASATAIIHWNAIPVFADIDRETFCLDPKSVEAAISPRTRAIMAVDIFGQSAPMRELRRLADQHGLKIISDTAQAPGALYNGQYAGTLADIGGYSLNYHKHIHTGEGGILVTNDDDLAERMQLIRNHAEAVVGDKGVKNLSNMIGYNFRLGEIECAIGIEQLKKLDSSVENKQRTAEALTLGLRDLPGLRLPIVRPGCSHVYYMYPMIVDTEQLGVTREKLVTALAAEGVDYLAEGYCNIHLLPMYQRKIAYGSGGFPWSAPFCHREVSYHKGICPVAEELHENSYFAFQICMADLDREDISSLIQAFHKVWAHIEDLK